MAKPVMAKSKDVIEEVENILEEASAQIDQETRRHFERQVKSVQDSLAQIGSTQRVTLDSIEGSALRSRLREIVKILIYVIAHLSKAEAVRASEHLIRQCHVASLHAEGINRTLDLLDPLLSNEMHSATLMWMAERGTKDHLGRLLQMKGRLHKDLEKIVEIADRRMSERLSKKADPDRTLRTFLTMNQQEFAHVLSDVDWESRLPSSLREYTPLKTLQLIRETLEDLAERDEIARWLHSPIPNFDGKSPVEAIKEGEAFRVLQVLVGVEEGIPD